VTSRDFDASKIRIKHGTRFKINQKINRLAECIKNIYIVL